MATGELWFKVPSAIKFVITGKPSEYVSGKDVILHIIDKIGVDGALYKSMSMRSMVRENHVRTEELIYPLFVMEGENIVQPVESMPGICQYSVDRMNEELDRVKALQIPAILIFGIPEQKAGRSVPLSSRD